MKKAAYVAGGVLIGFILATTTGAFADSVKSLIGKKVTGEYTVVVNGEKIADKGAVIDGRANVPVRGISEALGADIKVSGKTISVTTMTAKQDTGSEATTQVTEGNKYLGSSKKSLEELKYSIEHNRIKPIEDGRKEILAEIEILKTSGMNGQPAPGLAVKQAQLAEYDELLANAKEELRLVEEALAAIK